MGRKKDTNSGDLFVEDSGQLRTTDKSVEQKIVEARKVECLGITFENDGARRQHFIERLAEKLKDPEFRKTEGFPKGSDEEILALSDPPYYTACPNPFLGDFVGASAAKEVLPTPVKSFVEPYAVDVSVGRYSPESLAHSYHTKVPARAIARYVLHYTKPGDVVLDGFCGSGMTAIGTALCSGDDASFKSEIAAEKMQVEWGIRKCIISDLAPAASFIAANYIRVPSESNLERRLNALTKEMQEATGWMYRTKIDRKDLEAETLHTIWSDVISCPSCSQEIRIWDVAVASDGEIDKTDLSCPHCKSAVSSSDFVRLHSSDLDPVTSLVSPRVRNDAVQIDYKYDNKRGTKQPDTRDAALLQQILSQKSIRGRGPVKMMFRDGVWGDMYRSGYHAGVTHAHHFYTYRNYLTLSMLRDKCLSPRVRWGESMLLTSIALKSSRLMRYMSDGIGRIQNGVLYIASLSKETSPDLLLGIATKQLTKYAREVHIDYRSTMISTGSSSDLRTIPPNSIDYIFVDPPFGGNIMYSELNFLWEYWLGVYTENTNEGIINKSTKKDFRHYSEIMLRCFREFHRVLKAGSWITIEFHNSQNSIWNALQEAILRAGLVIADVRTLDKKQGTFKQVTTRGAVKQDLVLSAYKPNGGLEERFKVLQGTEEGAWSFTREHLKHLPVFVEVKGRAEVVAERQPYLLFDRMVAFHLQRGASVPLSAPEYYAGLTQRFSLRDEMLFLPEQAAEYDRRRAKVDEVLQTVLLVSDERSALQWLRQLLEKRPSTYQEIHPLFIKELHKAAYEKLPELKEMLMQSSLEYDGVGVVPAQIHKYLTSNFSALAALPANAPAVVDKAKGRWYVPDPHKQIDMEKVRAKALLKEFDEYKVTKKGLKEFRMEAVRAGFTDAWNRRDFKTIVDVAGKLPAVIVDEDPTLMQYVDVARDNLGE